MGWVMLVFWNELVMCGYVDVCVVYDDYDWVVVIVVYDLFV